MPVTSRRGNLYRSPDDRPGHQSAQPGARPEEEEPGRSGTAPVFTPLVSPIPDRTVSGIATSPDDAADGEAAAPAGNRLQTSRVPKAGPATQSTGPKAPSEFPADTAPSEGLPPALPEAPLVPSGPGQSAALERQPAMPAPESRPKSREAPSVHVTIGRVEVRAHTAPPPPRERRPSVGSALSLQDYLERGGGRRS